jgi:hypothetical protein
MRRILAMLFGVMLGGGLVFAAFEYHLVRADKTFHLVPKKQAGLVDAYVDIRDWSASQWKDHAVLAENLIADGHGDLVGGSIAGGLLDDFIAPFQQNASESTQRWWNSGQN